MAGQSEESEEQEESGSALGSGEGTALVLSGGGARGAYQVGVLAGLLEHGFISASARLPFDIFVGSSAGSINATALAASAHRGCEGIGALEAVWSQVEARQIFRTDLPSLARIGARWVRDLSFGGFTGKVAAQSLLDTAPLREMLAQWIDFPQIAKNVESGALRALALSATEILTSTGVVFVEGAPDQPLWESSRRRAEHAAIGPEHVMASSAIPILFPTVQVGERYFGDGCIRNTAPLSPAIHLGAERIVAIGVRESRQVVEKRVRDTNRPPSIAEISATLLDAVMLDAIEVDVAHTGRINDSVIRCPQPLLGSPFRNVDVLWISPSQDIGEMAAELAERVPAIVRYLLRGLGSAESTTELTSYLLFDPVFCSRLIALGREDVRTGRHEIGEFFSQPPR